MTQRDPTTPAAVDRLAGHTADRVRARVCTIVPVSSLRESNWRLPPYCSTSRPAPIGGDVNWKQTMIVRGRGLRCQ